MKLLAGISYDPSTAATYGGGSLTAMTAFDTTNLRNTFTAPSNGTVLVRLRFAVHGATASSQILLGVLDGATVRARSAPVGIIGQPATATTPLILESTSLVTGLTAGTSYTWDAAYGVEFVVASSVLKLGGPNNTTTNDNFGAGIFEVWSTEELLAGVLYDPGTAVANKATNALLAMTAFDTTNLRLTFTAPGTSVLVRVCCMNSGGTATIPGLMLGVLDGATVRMRNSPTQGRGGVESPAATTHLTYNSVQLVTGLTAGTSYTWDAAYGVEIAVSSSNIKYGGPDDATQDNAYGGLSFSIWNPLPYGLAPGQVI